ncbi:hypothetical protein [Nocardioides sp. Arc9.136]|uniref:hypothetical protein n=1 Tax=Nocardioides sp. Arc9.136 TaxID=2996826 RepID=UPI002666F5BE|nr:hypothetical protein [Nocardioides sp. Arc9.136]WKN48595.1 hypothetical protein OSR43_00265 [Nocardioides sp. Arc9.136]
MAAPRRRWTPTLAVVLVAALVNLPVVHGLWLDRRLAADGVVRVATVEAHRERGDAHLLQYVVEDFPGTADVDPDVYEQAVRTGQVAVRVLPDDPSARRVEGEVRGRLGLVLALVADAALALMLLLLWRFRGRHRPQLRLVATGDVERCPPGARLEPVGDQHVVCGDVLEIGDGELVLDLGDLRVQVLLDGHVNQVGHQQPARVTGRLV